MRRPSKTLVGSMTRSSITGSRPKISVNGSADSRVRCSGEATSAATGRSRPCTYSAAWRAIRRPSALSPKPGRRP